MKLKDKLEEMLIEHEGLKLKPYRCTAGKLTIGVGRNLDDNGITEAEARMMLRYDIEVAFTQLIKYKWFTNLDDVRKMAIVDMAFNLGMPRFLQFKKFIECLSYQKYENAAEEMLHSLWAKQVGKRAIRLSEIIKTGKF